MRIDELPDLLRVEQAAAYLQISRNRAYEETARYERTGGAAGLPCIRIGRSVRIPRHALEHWLAEQLHPHTGATRDDVAS